LTLHTAPRRDVAFRVLLLERFDLLIDVSAPTRLEPQAKRREGKDREIARNTPLGLQATRRLRDVPLHWGRDDKARTPHQPP
jgi:hypothetical protein